MKKIPKKVLQGLKQVGEETGKELVEQTKRMVTGTISGKELVADANMMTNKEMVEKQVEDEKKKKEEMGKLRGRDVEGEIVQVRKEKKQKEEEEEREFLEKVKRQRQVEEQERQSLASEVGASSSPEKRKKKRGSAFVKGKKKTSTADMSATGEFGKNKN